MNDNSEVVENSMERLKPYCVDIHYIDGLLTFIISPSKYEDIVEDKELLKWLGKSEFEIDKFTKIAKEVGTDKIYLGFVYLTTIINMIKRYHWIPIHCYKNGNEFYHVFFRYTWMCRACGNIMNKPIIMPMVEADTTIYHWSDNGYPRIPLIFNKVNCPKCGNPLQNHLIIMD